MGHCLVRRLVGGCRSAHRRRAPPRSRPRLRRRLILAPRARHALRRGLAGGQRTRRHQCAAHQPRAPAPRFLLAQGPMEGVETEWRGPSTLQLVAGAGKPGIYDGIKVPTFQTLGGSTATLGAQWAPASPWALGGEFAAARDVSLYYQPLGATFATAATARISSTTGFLTAAWQDGASRAQINVIDGTVDGNGNSLGMWVDASHTQGAMTQSFGAFRIDPNLAWGNQLISSDVQGGYYRVDYRSRRWLADFGADQVRSVSGNGSNTTFVNGDARYQLSRDLGLGGVVYVRRSDSTSAWSAEAYLDNANSYGLGRGQLD